MADVRAQYYAIGAVVAALVVPAYIFGARARQSYLVRQYTATVDLQRVGAPRAGGRLPGTVVVCGGSFAGLMTARVCSDHFEHVVVVEPEAWVLSEEARKGPLITGTRTVTSGSGVEYETYVHKRTRVVQYLGGHIYQVFLVRFLRKLFPDFDTKAKARGIIFGPADFRARLNGWRFGYPYAEYAARGENLPETIFSTRRMLESLVGDIVHEACPAVEYVNGTATGLTITNDGVHVTSVAIRLADGTTRDIPCAMVVGNTQAGLKLLGRALPTHKHLPPRLRASYDPRMNLSGVSVPLPPGWDEAIEPMRDAFVDPLYKGPSSNFAHYVTWAVDPDRDNHTFFISRSEAGLSLGTYGWESDMPVSLEQVREYTKKLVGDIPPPSFIEGMLDLMDSVADQATSVEIRINSCSRVFYENAHTVLPCNFVAVGDSTMRLNPRFGEGVTKTAVGAATLDGALREFREGPAHRSFGRTFFKRLADRTSGLWDAAKSSDYGAATTIPVEGETLKHGAFQRWFTHHLLRAAARDEALASGFWHVGNFLAPGASLSTPSVVFKVLWQAAFPTTPI